MPKHTVEPRRLRYRSRAQGSATAFGHVGAEHYLFPLCENGHIDPTRFQKSWQTACRKLTAAVGLKGFRFHDCRHHAITELAESDASDATIMGLVGHVSRRRLSHYFRDHAKRSAVKEFSAKRPRSAESTSHVTNLGVVGIPAAQVIEKHGRHVGTRTPDLYRVKVAL